MMFNIRLDFFILFFAFFCHLCKSYSQSHKLTQYIEYVICHPYMLLFWGKLWNTSIKIVWDRKISVANAICVLARQWSQVNSDSLVQTSHTDAGEKPSFGESNLPPADHLAIPCEKHLKESKMCQPWWNMYSSVLKFLILTSNLAQHKVKLYGFGEDIW